MIIILIVLNLLYTLNGSENISNCYDSCETCSDYSQDITDQ